jgi:enoyl-CoA hydratase/carnithine racemase
MELTIALVRLPMQLDPDSVAALTRDLEDALRSTAAVVVIRGASADTFCTGLALGGAPGVRAATHAFAQVLERLHDANRPVLAAVDGRAIGGGLGIASACDWVIASDRATFALPELLWGLLPAIIWPVIADRMAPHVARRWTISAHARSAAEAREAGLVDDIVAAEALDRGVRRAGRALARLEPMALRRFRGWTRASRCGDLAGALAAGADLTADMVREPAVAERWRAFVEGGAPWSA